MICAANKSRKTCQQDSRLCRHPMTCSGSVAETDAAIASIRLHRVPDDSAPELGTQDEAVSWMVDLAVAALICIVAAFVATVLGLAAAYLAAVDWMDLLRAWP